MTRILFFGDLVGEPALAYLEANLAQIMDTHEPDFVIANAENLDITSQVPGACGMTPESLARVFELPIDLVTGGNHSWDAPDFRVHEDERVLRPLNYGADAPGRGAAIIEGDNGVTLGVVNIVLRDALTAADHPLTALEWQLENWECDFSMVDLHGTSVHEKATIAHAIDGRVTAIVGTHTHIQTNDLQVLPKGTAYVTDVGMVGPTGGVQGYDPVKFVNSMRLRLPSADWFMLAEGPVSLGAVLITAEAGKATVIERL